jgi:hypothetical protein
MSRHKLVALAIVLALFASPVLALLWMTAVPGKSWTGPLPPLSPKEADLATRLRTHVEAIASEPHNIGHPQALERSARYIEQTLGDLGLFVQSHPFDGGRARNIDAVIAPPDHPGPTIVIGAHYDSAFNAPGANDTGSGAAALLELARLLAGLDGETAHAIKFVFFANEEPPFFQTDRMGSLVYARELVRSGEKVEAMLSLETMGYYRDTPGSQRYPFPLSQLYPDTGNFIAFVGTVGSRPLVRRTVAAFRTYARFPSQGGTAPAFVQGIDWSDHWAFEQQGIPALMVTDTAPFRYPWYHDKRDMPDKIDYQRLARVVAGLEQVIRHWK